jgi:hypothetical protein
MHSSGHLKLNPMNFKKRDSSRLQYGIAQPQGRIWRRSRRP